VTIKIGRYTEPGLGSVNTWWIEADRGVIVIDGQRELSKARKALREIEATGKPIVAVIRTRIISAESACSRQRALTCRSMGRLRLARASRRIDGVW
jgi:hypothetical protein